MNKQKVTDKQNKDLCSGCSECCKYIAVQIDKPRSKKDYNNILWFLLHQNIHVGIDWDNDWYLEVMTPCTQLDKKTHLCADYARRPAICRQYSQKECTRYNSEPAEKILFKNADEFRKYLKKKKIIL